MARGVRFGRKPKLTAHQVKEAVTRREAGEALADIGRSYNVSHSTISRLPIFQTGVAHPVSSNGHFQLALAPCPTHLQFFD